MEQFGVSPKQKDRARQFFKNLRNMLAISINPRGALFGPAVVLTVSDNLNRDWRTARVVVAGKAVGKEETMGRVIG